MYRIYEIYQIAIDCKTHLKMHPEKKTLTVIKLRNLQSDAIIS